MKDVLNTIGRIKNFALVRYIALIALLTSFGNAFAAGDGATGGLNELSSNINGPVCTIYGILVGPIGVTVIIICIVIGGFMLVFGNRNAMKMVWSALAGAAVVFLAGAILSIVTTNAASCGAKGTGLTKNGATDDKGGAIQYK